MPPKRSRLQSTSSEARSGSVTPTSTLESFKERPSAAHRALRLGIGAGNKPKDSEINDKFLTPRRPKSGALGVRRTPGGSLKAKEKQVDTPCKSAQRTPGGQLRQAVDVPLCSDVLERVEALDVSDEEAEELLQMAPWHVQRWVEDLGSFPVTPSTPVLIDLGSVEDITDQRETDVSSAGVWWDVIPEADVQPSTSGVKKTSKLVPRRQLEDGSEFDSDFDDEFDISPVETTAARKDIPDNDELEEPIRDIISNIEKGMDIISTAKESFRRLGFVLRNCREFDNHQVIRLLYSTLVRSKLDCGSCLWNPHEKSYALMLEKVQKAFLRYLYKRKFGYYPYLYPTMFLLGCLNFNSLQVRRAQDQLVTAYKILCGAIDAPSLHEELCRFYVPTNYTRARRHNLFAVPRCRTVSRSMSPIPRILRAFNALLDSNNELDLFADEKKVILLECLKYCEKTE